MGLDDITQGAYPLQTQPHHPVLTSSTSRLTTTWLMRKQGDKATLLVIQPSALPLNFQERVFWYREPFLCLCFTKPQAIKKAAEAALS